MTKQTVTKEARPIRINWAISLKKLVVGGKLLVHNDYTQSQVGAAISKHNRNGKRFVSKKAEKGVYVIRVT